jgi:hypothetical protein
MIYEVSMVAWRWVEYLAAILAMVLGFNAIGPAILLALVATADSVWHIHVARGKQAAADLPD